LPQKQTSVAAALAEAYARAYASLPEPAAAGVRHTPAQIRTILGVSTGG
jgi:hypothetical protein